MDQRGRKHVVVLGGGFGGVYSAIRLARARRHGAQIDITLVSDENFFLYTPLLHEVATGGVETRHIAYPLRRLCQKYPFSFRKARVQTIDLDGGTVTMDNGMLPYDYLVIALGGTTNTSNLPNSSGNVFTLKNLHDGMVIRNHIIRMFEVADAEGDIKRQKQLLTFMVVGGGYTGVQLVAEIRNFAARCLLKGYRNVDGAVVRVVLVEDRDQIIPEGDPVLARTALQVLQRQGVEVKLNTRVTRLWDHGLELNRLEMESTETVIWVPGIVANAVVSALPVEKDEKGRVVVDEFLRVRGYANVFALGDNARFTDPRTGAVLPPRAHYAVRQPKTVVANILACMAGGLLKPYRFRGAAELVSLGPRTAAMNLYGVHISGLLARVVWLVGYLSIMMGFYNRTRVVVDWLLALLFGRDSTLLSVSR